MGYSRQEFWSGLPFPSPKDLPDPGVEPMLPALQVDSLTYALPRKPFLADINNNTRTQVISLYVASIS